MSEACWGRLRSTLLTHRVLIIIHEAFGSSVAQENWSEEILVQPFEEATQRAHVLSLGEIIWWMISTGFYPQVIEAHLQTVT